MRRLIFLILFVLFTIATIAWLTGLESPFSGAKTHSVLTHDGKSTRVSGTKSEPAKPISASLLLGANVDSNKQASNKAQAAAGGTVPSLISIEIRKEGEWHGDSNAKKLISRFAAEGITANPGGSGLFVDSRGTILTNFSTLLGGFSWKVHASDGKEYEAELVGIDPSSDLALIRIAKQETLPVRWSGNQPNFAETLLLLGFDAKNGPRVMDVMTSSGIMEAANSEEAISLKYFLVDYDFLDHCPGWLLSNLDGGVVGIVTHIENATDERKRDTVIVSSESLLPIIDSLQGSPLLRRVYIGMESQQLTPALANLTGVKLEKGLLVTKLQEDSPLLPSGLQAGDIVVGLGGTEVISKGQFYQLLGNMVIGAKVPLQIQRGDQRLTLHIVLREQKKGMQQLAQQWLDLVAKNRKESSAKSQH